MVKVVHVNTLNQFPNQLIIPTLNWTQFQTYCLILHINYHHKPSKTVLKASGVNFSKFQCYKHCKQNAIQQLRLKKCKSKIPLGIHLCTSFPYGLQPAISGLANQELLANLPPYYSRQFHTVHTQHTWPYTKVTHKFQNLPIK